MQQQKQVEMTEGQQAIIKGLIANYFGEIDTSTPHITSMRAIRKAVPDMNDDEIGKELRNWEGVQRVGSVMEDQISIPGKYFK